MQQRNSPRVLAETMNHRKPSRLLRWREKACLLLVKKQKTPDAQNRASGAMFTRNNGAMVIAVSRGRWLHRSSPPTTLKCGHLVG